MKRRHWIIHGAEFSQLGIEIGIRLEDADIGGAEKEVEDRALIGVGGKEV